MVMYTIFMGFIEFMNHNFYIFMCLKPSHIHVFGQGETKNVFILDIGDQNKTYVQHTFWVLLIGLGHFHSQMLKPTP